MKVINYDQIGKLIKDNDVVAISGSGGSGSPEWLLKGLMECYLKNNHPQNIGVTCGISPGNLTLDDVGMNMLAKPGLIGKAYCAHLGMGKKFGIAIAENKFPAFAIPLGVINHLYRAIAAGELGIITKIGLNTFADPRIEGCCANDLAKKEKPIVKLLKIDGKETLFYKAFPINVALIKASCADADGNISFEDEAVLGEQINMAMAAHNSKGIVIVEVNKIRPKNSIKAKDVLLHKKYIDYIVVGKPDTSLGEYNLPKNKPELSGKKKINLSAIEIRNLDERKICGRRCLFELHKNDLVNLGVGMPDSVANAACEEGISENIILSLETGITGGVPIGGVAFGASINPESIIPTASQLDYYNGGVLDAAILGFAEVDKHGNVNVSKLGNRITGPGGFINITQTTKKIIFIGTFTAKDLKEKIQNNKLIIENDGTVKKFVSKVKQITFSAENAIKNNLDVLYITERCVFKLTSKGLELIEIAPGVDIKKDIINKMEFKPLISKNIKLMDKRIFQDKKMNIKKEFK